MIMYSSWLNPVSKCATGAPGEPGHAIIQSAFGTLSAYWPWHTWPWSALCEWIRKNSDFYVTEHNLFQFLQDSVEDWSCSAAVAPWQSSYSNIILSQHLLKGRWLAIGNLTQSEETSMCEQCYHQVSVIFTQGHLGGYIRQISCRKQVASQTIHPHVIVGRSLWSLLGSQRSAYICIPPSPGNTAEEVQREIYEDCL